MSEGFEEARASSPRLTSWELQFLHESNAIETIANVDYALEENAIAGRGHAGALMDAMERARQRTPLTVEDLCQWQRWITEEQLRFGHWLPVGGAGVLRSRQYPHDVRVAGHLAPSFIEVPALADALIADLGAWLAQLPMFPADADAAEALGTFLQRFEAIHPFVDGNGRTGRVLAGYIAVACGGPLIVVRASERPAFYRAHRSKLAMRVFMADKVREAVDWPGRGVLVRQETHHSQDVFDGLIVQRHALLERRQAWVEALAAKDREAAARR